MQKNASARERYKWGTPGGKLERGEAPFEGLQREVEEETGLIFPKDTIDHIETCYIQKPDWQYTCHLYLYKASLKTKPALSLSKEHLAFSWKGSLEIEQMDLLDGTRAVFEAFRAYFS